MKKLIITFLMAFLPVVAFNAKAQENAMWNGYDASGVSILPKAMAEYCQITQDDIDSLAATMECLNLILRLKSDASAEVQLQAKELSDIILRQSIYTPNAEGIEIKIKAFQFPLDVTDFSGDESKDPSQKTVMENVGAASPEQELLTALIMLETEGSKLDKQLLQIKASEVLLNEFMEFNNYKEKM